MYVRSHTPSKKKGEGGAISPRAATQNSIELARWVNLYEEGRGRLIHGKNTWFYKLVVKKIQSLAEGQGNFEEIQDTRNIWCQEVHINGFVAHPMYAGAKGICTFNDGIRVGLLRENTVGRRSGERGSHMSFPRVNRE